MKKFCKKNKIVLAKILYMVAVCASVYFIFIPLVKGVRQAAAKIQENLADQKAENERLRQIPQMEEDLKAIESRSEALNAILKPENEIEFIENIESIALKSHCVITLDIGEYMSSEEINKLKKQKAKKGQTKKGIMDEITSESYFPMKITLKSDYAGLANFIKMLENSQIYVNIISMRVTKEIVKETNDLNRNPFGKGEKPKTEKEILNATINTIVYTQ